MSSPQPSTSYAPYQSHRRIGSGTGSSHPSPLKPPPPLRRLASSSNSNGSAANTSANHIGQQLPSRNLNGSAAASTSASSSTLPAQVQRLRLGAGASASNSRNGNGNGVGSNATDQRDGTRSADAPVRSTPRVEGTRSADQVQNSHRHDNATASRTSSGRSTPRPGGGGGTTNDGIASPARSTPRNGHRATPSTSSVISTAEALRIRSAAAAAAASSAGTRTPTPTSAVGTFDNAQPHTLPPQRFQPRGTTRSRFADFVEARNNRKRKRSGGGAAGQADDTARYEERIQRRVDKLLSIHDPATDLSTESYTAPQPTSRLLSTLAPHSRFLTTLRTASTLRSLEQALVPWQADETALECPICKSAFGYGRRKHHCRACGRVVCADVRTGGERCSGNVVASGASATGTRGIQDAPSDSQSLEEILNGSGGGNGTPSRTTAPTHSPFRLCKDCKFLIQRRQYMHSGDTSNSTDLPPYVRLYNELTTLQQEIEQRLPEFQELIMGLQRDSTQELLPTTNPATLRDASTARKQLLSNFASYDSIAKQIRNVGLSDPSLHRLTSAIERKAAAFLQANMFPLQSLPANTSASGKKSATTKVDKEKQAQIEVLLEQRRQIEGFLERAQRGRMLNDVPLLRANLDELDREIERMRA